MQSSPELAGQPLAETDVADGRVLPFGSVDCDMVRQFIEPTLRFLSPEDKNGRLGIAIARVSAHEIYHMLTGSEGHARQGIARATHSREELTAPTFAFARDETNWLRAWAEANPGKQRAVAAVDPGTGTIDTESSPSASASPAGR